MGPRFTTVPIDANYNPAGAKLNQERYHIAVGLNEGTLNVGLQGGIHQDLG